MGGYKGALPACNETSSEYGRVTFYQGFKDAVNLMTEIHQSLK